MNSQDLEKVMEEAVRALKLCSNYTKQLASRYADAAGDRYEEGIPVIALCGPGRCGKDTAGLYISSRYNVNFGASTSFILAHYVAAIQDRTVEDVMATRHDEGQREYLYEFGNALRRYDPSFLIRSALVENDIVAGVRAAPELYSAKADGLIDLTIWIDNPRVEHDPTLEYRSDDCDLVIRNATSLSDFYGRLDVLCDRLLKLPRRKAN